MSAWILAPCGCCAEFRAARDRLADEVVRLETHLAEAEQAYAGCKVARVALAEEASAWAEHAEVAKAREAALREALSAYIAWMESGLAEDPDWDGSDPWDRLVTLATAEEGAKE